MKTKFKVLLAVLILPTVFAVTLLLQGCGIARTIKDSDDRQHYLDYRSEAERINLEREKAGLQPQKIMTLEEWKAGK